MARPAVSEQPGFLEILDTLPIEEQRSALQWLRQRAAELGCSVDEEPFISKDGLNFPPSFDPMFALN